MNKENKVKRVGKQEVGSPDSLSKVLELVEVGIFDYFFESLKNQHLKEFLIGPSSSYEPFIRLFDLRFLSSLFLRNLRHSVKRGSSITLESLMLLTIPIFMHCLSDRSSIERGFILTKIINGGDVLKKEQAENYGDFSYDRFLRFKRSLSVEKDGKRRTPVSYYVGSKKNNSAGSTKDEKQVRYNAMNPLVSGRWKVCIVRDSLLGGDISKGDFEKIQLFWRDRYSQNYNGFFKFYNHAGVSKNGSDCYQSDFDSLFFWKIRNKRDLDGLQAPRSRNDSLSPLILDSCDKALLESEYSADCRGNGSVFHFEREAFSNLSSFPSWKKTMSFRDCIFGFYCHRNGEDSPILPTYSQMKNGLINRLTEFLSIIEKSNLIFHGAISVDINNSVKSGKRFPSKLKEDLRILGKELGLPSSSIYLDLSEILPKYFEVSLGVVTNRGENTTFLNQLKGKGNIHPIYSLVRLYGRNRIISLYSTYIFLFYDYFCALSTEYFSRIKYRLDGWAGSGESTGVPRIATEQRLLEWKNNIERLLDESINFRIDEYKNVQSNVHRWLDTTENSSFFPKGKVFLETKYDLGESICGVSILRNELLNSFGTSIGNTNQHNEKYFHRFLNVLFLYKMMVAEVTRQEVLVDTIDYCIEKLNDIDLEKLNTIDLEKLDLLSGLFDGYIDEQIISLKTILERKRSLFSESRLLMNKKSVGSSTALEPAANLTPVGLPRIEATRTGFSNDALSTTKGQIWNLFLQNLNRGKGSTRDIGGSISRYIFDEVNELNFLDHSNLPVQNCAGSDFIPRIKRDFLIGKCNSSYFDVLTNFYVGSDDETTSSNIISSIYPQLSDLLSSNLSKQTAGETADHVLTPVQSISSNLHESATSLLTHSDRLFYSISDLKRLLALFLSPCSSAGIDLEKTLINSDPSADRRPRPRPKNLGLDRVNLEKFIENGSGSKNVSTKNRFYQDDSSIGSFWEPERLETLYWSLRLSLGNDVTSRSLAGSIGKKVPHKNAEFADPSIQKEPIRPSYFINFDELSKDLNNYKISWIFWRDNIGEKWSLFRDYIPWFFTPNWWRYFYDLIRETYPEIVLKFNDDLNHNLPRIFKRIVEDIDGAKAWLFQSLGLRFKNDSINIILSKIDLLILEEIPDEAEMSHPRGWSVSKSSNKSIFYYFILSILFVLVFFKHHLSAVSGSNSLHSWKRFNTVEYLTDPKRGSYLKKVMYSPSTRQMSTRDLLIYSLNSFLNYINNIIFFLFIKNELDSWIFRRESSDIPDSKKELLTQYLVTNSIISKYASKLNSNYDLLSNEISREPHPQERSNVLAYLLQFRQNDLLSHKIRKVDPAEKWALSALERNILFSVTTRRRGSLLNVPCQDIPISLESGLLPSKGILLVGPVETGRSSIIRDVAFNSYFPLVKLPFKKLIYNRSFFNNVRGNFISKESVHRLNLVFAIAEEVSPCTLWIQDIHELNIHRSYNKLEADPRFLLCQILRSISHRRSNSSIRRNIIIASTHVPAGIDPAPIAPNRLNQLINFRKSNRYQRQKELSILLRIKGFEIETNPSLLEGTGSGTTGYSKRDLFIFANEALLIGTSKRKKVVGSDAIGLALHRQHSTVTDMRNGVKSGSECEISSYEIAGATLKNSLIDTYPTNIPFIGRNELKMRFYYLSNWYVEPSTTESTINEFTLFLHSLGLLAGLVARDSSQMDIREKENSIVIDKLVENDLNLASGVLENLSKNFLRSEICRGENQYNNSLSLSFPTDKLKYCSGVTSTSRSSKFMRKGVFNSLTDFEPQQSPELINLSSTKVSREITWSHKAWRLRFLRNKTYELMRILSEPNHLGNLVFLYRNQNYIPQQDFEFNKIKGDKNKWYEKRVYLFSFERSVTNATDKSIKRLENRLENMLLREQFLELGLSDDSSNEYETHCNRFDDPTRFFGGRFIWDPMLLFQSDPNIPPSRRSLLPTQELARRLYIIYGMGRQRRRTLSNRKIKNFFLYRGDNPKLKPDSSIKRWNNLPLDEEERDSEDVKETSFMDIYLQYPQIFNPARLDCYVVAEDFPERFIRFRLLVHRNKWMRRNRSPFQDFLIYNTLLETY
uniref:Conserved hypothetical chloroplast protein ycf2 n=1 Tax=Saccoloma inaequale TaxID=262953 RepID=A0A5B9REJ7_9MONI|nr:conserved hypothetical chloroplast protein ycf2 [Saccoloma inaequale]YP_009691073.1 conserved hypothetical chloroplast protein ycf2 [Saccoloma inaequale]QEG57837.1 conserved hypothetical chloroplast protein ycf2 [Saccoloma inaequale]QEG57853.1 conserved hypothetical chloroplast protein ycf2 [Saccoloma inaequale]